MQTLSQAFGGSASQSDLNNITTALTAVPKGGSGLSERLSQARNYDQANWGYNGSYVPGDHNKDSNMPNLTLQQVQGFLQQIKQHCGCQIKNGSKYK